ncbi:MAG: hypothetical protein GF320_12650, partial [Armatimonadia bacterium]|nr:hypothetical protein [Armatimonadia bacterium]
MSPIIALSLALSLGQAPSLENDLLRVTLDPSTGALSIVDIESGMEIRQPDTVRDTFREGPEIQVRRAPEPIELDGQLDEWATAELVDVGEAARAALLWDDHYLYAAFEVTDPDVVSGEPDATDWEATDHVAWWAGWDQVRYPARADLQRGYAWGDWQDWAEVAVARTDGGYVVEARSPLGNFVTLRPVVPGRLFRTAFTVSTEDGEQAGYPSDLELSARPTYAVGVLVGEEGETPGVPIPPNAPTDIATPEPGTLAYTVGVERFEAPIGKVRCTVRLPEGSRRVEFECEPLDGWEWDMSVLRGFLPDGRADYMIPLYGNGLLVPADDLTFPITHLGVFGSLDMPGIGLVADEGAALCLLETHDYMGASLEPATWGDRRALSCSALAERDELEAPSAYRLSWEVFPGGDQMDVALAMREFCRQRGWWKTLEEKRQQNPEIEKLMGAPIVWGSSGADFAEEAAASGMRRMLVAGSYDADQIRRITDLGYLCGEYDNYVDADDAGPTVDGELPVPDLIRRTPDGDLAKGWLTLDGSKQYYSLCSHFALPAARAEITEDLRQRPYNARFLDVHTAMSLVECYDEDHPLTRTQDRENKIALLQWIRNQGLVLGGEHGRAWSVPVLDYQEGMLSCNPMFTWPAGHLVKVDDEDQIGERYLEWGLNPARRIPFWEMVFHGCVVSTWYWGDSVGYLEDVRPDLTDRKIAMTAQYGSAPLMWATDLGLVFQGQGRARFLQAYNAICPLHEVIGWEEMVSHEYLSEDRMVQRTRFSGGTEVTANFGPDPVTVTSGGEEWVLPENGMVADGPRIHAHHLPGEETYAEIEGYRALVSHTGERRERGGLQTASAIAVTLVDGSHARIHHPFGESALLGEHIGAAKLGVFVPGYDPGSVRVMPAATGTTAMVHDVYFGDATLPADLRVHGPVVSEEDRPDKGFTMRAVVANDGRTTGTGTLALYWDRVTDERLAGAWPVALDPGEEEIMVLHIPEPMAVGRHTA